MKKVNNIDLPVDAKGIPFQRPTLWLEPTEYAKICSEINDSYESLHKGYAICTHTSFGLDGKVYNYWFENHGFNDYNIFSKVLNTH